MPVKKHFSILIQLVLLLLPICTQANAASAQELQTKSLVVLNHQTGWALDGIGYHPAVYLLLENISGHDLSGETIKIQGKFTDIHTLEPSVARMEVRRELKPHQVFPFAIIAPQAYELPRSVNHWPAVECKIMARVGNVGDEGTEYLLITKIDQVTQTEDTAFQKLNEVASYRKPSNRNTYKNASAKPAKALAATSNKLPAPNKSINDNDDLFNQKSLPGLGDDFYTFEQSFGLPALTDTHNKELTWAKYRSHGTEIMVASRENTGKADMIVLLVPKNKIGNEKVFAERAKALAGKLKSQTLGLPVRSVKYLPSGRLELSTIPAPGYKIYFLKPTTKNEPGENVIVVLSRLPKEADAIVRSQLRNNEVLKTLPLDPH
ncbi:MAG: hypothetical protein K2W82_03340 [Candidatus Obscuribacterales bacterium]|nr:hypothetical protein [Candidatus Obscuribacterales bacterium]